MTLPQLDIENDRVALRCPRCGSEKQRHEPPLTFIRDEDEDRVVIHQPGSRARVVPNEESLNPSPTRDGVLVTCICAGCGQTNYLAIAHHEGQTFVGWR